MYDNIGVDMLDFFECSFRWGWSTDSVNVFTGVILSGVYDGPEWSSDQNWRESKIGIEVIWLFCAAGTFGFILKCYVFYPDCSWCAGWGGCCPLNIKNSKLEKKNCISPHWSTGKGSRSRIILWKCSAHHRLVIMELSVSDDFEVPVVLCWWSGKCFLHHHCGNRTLLAHFL